MQAVVFADRRGSELAPLTDFRCPALLQIANRPVIQHTVEDLATAGIDDILLFVSDGAADIRATLGDGSMWGVRIRYLLSRGEEAPAALLSRVTNLLAPTFLAARGDVLRLAACAPFLRAVQPGAGSMSATSRDGRALGLCLVREPTQPPCGLEWPPRQDTPPAAFDVRIDEALFSALDSVADVHHASRAVACLTSSAARQPGREIATGLRVDPLSRVDTRTRVDGTVLIGERSWVHPSASFEGTCVVGSDCYIERGAHITDSVVMPGSYVGESLHVENAIVAGRHLLRTDLGTQVEVADAMLLAENGVALGCAARRWRERLAGLALLTVSLPLWPAALVSAVVCAPRAPVTPVDATSRHERGDARPKRRSRVGGWCFNTPVPLLRDMPLLIDVVLGDMRLFGATRGEATMRPHGSASTGTRYDSLAALLGPAELYLAADAPAEEIWLNERAFEADTRARTFLARLGVAARALFTGRPWRARANAAGRA